MNKRWGWREKIDKIQARHTPQGHIGWWGGSSAGVTGVRSQKPIRSFLNPDANSKALMQLCSICRHVNIHARLSRRRPQGPVFSRPVPPPGLSEATFQQWGGGGWGGGKTGSEGLKCWDCSPCTTRLFCVALRLPSGGSFFRADSTERLQLRQRARLQAGGGAAF